MRPRGCVVLIVIALLIIFLLSWVTGINVWFFICLFVLAMVLIALKEAYDAPERQELILSILIKEDRELYGLEIVKLSEGRIKRGEVYADLRDLQNAGFVTSRLEREPEHEQDCPRSLYRATGKRRQKRKISFHLPVWIRPLNNPN